jgi:hypothetical protein
VRSALRKRWVQAVVAIVAVVMPTIAGDLPGQTDPTRIVVVPFSNIPGFHTPKPVRTAPAAAPARTPTP